MSFDFTKIRIEVPDNIFPALSRYVNPMAVVIEKIALTSSMKDGYDHILFFSEHPDENAIIFKGDPVLVDHEHIEFTKENEAIKVTVGTFLPEQRKIFNIPEVIKWYDDYMESEINKATAEDPTLPTLEDMKKAGPEGVKNLLMRKIASMLGVDAEEMTRAKPEDVKGELNISNDKPTEKKTAGEVELRPLTPDDPKFDPDDPTRFPIF